MKKCTVFSYIAFLLFLLPFLQVGAQTPEIVVSEYYNESFASQEWTELILIRNIDDMTGFVFTDNNVGQATWQGGVLFKNTPQNVWKNLREGTIIVIWHRDMPSGITRDIDKSDGYIEVSRNDREIFDEFLQATGSIYDDVALNVASGGDILQIRRSTNSTSSIHALAHKTIPGNSFTLINSYKINTPEDCPDESSNAVIPGRNIGDYTGAGKAQIVSGPNITRGLPNRNSANLNSENYKFWDSLREPEWTTANTLTYQYAPTGITLSWTPLANASSAEGYVILRAKTFPATFPFNFDGTIFKKGDIIPGFSGVEVVDTIAATANTYTDNFTGSFQLPCGEFYEYRIYPYRYGKDDQGKDNTPLNARGRSYNEDQFAKVTVSRPAFPAPPQVTVLGGGTFFVFCEGQSIALTAIPDNAASYQWLKDGVIIPGATNKIYVTTIAGKYAVRAFNTEGCADQSAEITVTKSSINAAFTDSLGVCETKLMASPTGSDYRYQWLNQSLKEIAGEIQAIYYPTQAGTYSVEITDNTTGCIDTSEARFINVNTADLSFQINGIPSSSAIDFGTLGECESSKKLILTVSTLSSFPILVTLTAPPGYRAEPSSFNLRSQSAQDVAIYFEPTASGNYDKPLKIESECDNLSTTISLIASKTIAAVAAVDPTVEYPAGISCEVQTTTQTVQIINSGTDVVNFLQPAVSGPFTVIAPAFPKSIAPNETLTVTVEYTTVPGLSNRILSIPYISVACTSDVKVELIARTIQPSITSSTSEFDFKTPEGCSQYKDSTIDITNPTDIPLTIPAQQLDANFSTVQAVTLDPNQTKAVTIRFTPTATGQITSNVILKADKCPDVANIGLLLKGNSGTPSLQSVPQFEVVTNCSPGFKTQKSNISTISATVIENIVIPAGFSVNGITIGQIINGLQPFDITFTPTAEGIYDDSLLVKFAGCPQSEKILLKGKKSTLNLAFKNPVVDFGTVTPNTPPAPQTATLVNTGSDTLTVNPFSPTAPFKTVSTSVALPARIAPNDSVVFIFEYEPVSENTDVYEFLSDPCNGIAQLLLKGNAEYPAGTGKAIVSLPVLRGAPGAIIEIPVMIADEANSFVLEKAAIRELTLTLMYDPMLLMPESVRTGDAAQGFDAATVSETTPGTAEIVLKSSGGAIIKSGIAAIVRAKVLLSGSPTTPIIISKITPTANSSVIFTQQNGEFILDDSCSVGRRLGGFSGNFMLKVNGEMPVSNNTAEVVFEINTDEMLELDIYNSFGQRVKTMYRGNVSAGQYISEIPLNGLSGGVYQIIMQTATNRVTAKLVIVR